MYKLVIIDDEYLVREGIKKTIDWNSHNVDLIGEASNGEEGYEVISRLKPDVIITDAKMPILNGLDLAKRLHDENYDGIIIVLSGYREFEYAQKAVDSEVFNYLLKPITNDELVNTVCEAINKLESKRSERKILSLYEESQDYIKLKIVRDIIRSKKLDITQVKNQLETNRLPFFESGVVVVITMDDYDEEFHDELRVLEELIVDDLDEEGILHIEALYHNRLVFILNSDENGGYRVLKHCLDHYEEQNDAVTFSSAISNPFDSIKQVSREYEVAKNLADSELMLSMNSILDAKNSHGRYSKNTGRALQIIFNEYYQALTVKYVAEKIDVSESYLAHLLKDDLGKTFNTLLTDCRIAHAKKLLKEKKFRVNEVAFKVGYNDERYFAAIFKKHVGVPPSKFQEEE